MKFIRNWKISVPSAGVVLAGLAWLAFGFFGIHTAFVDDEVAEALPEFSTPAPSAAIDEAPNASNADDAVADRVGDVATPEAAPVATEVVAEAPESEATPEPGVTVPLATAVPSTQPPATEPPAAPPAEPEIVTEASGTFAGNSRYDVSGEAAVLGNGSGQRFLRFEDFESSNGPDLNVYLFNPDDPNDFIDLGELKGNIGEQNYELAADVDLDRYSRVSIWCVRFGTGFGNADLAAA